MGPLLGHKLFLGYAGVSLVRTEDFTHQDSSPPTVQISVQSLASKKQLVMRKRRQRWLLSELRKQYRPHPISFLQGHCGVERRLWYGRAGQEWPGEEDSETVTELQIQIQHCLSFSDKRGTIQASLRKPIKPQITHLK